MGLRGLKRVCTYVCVSLAVVHFYIREDVWFSHTCLYPQGVRV